VGRGAGEQVYTTTKFYGKQLITIQNLQYPCRFLLRCYTSDALLGAALSTGGESVPHDSHLGRAWKQLVWDNVNASIV
jgi:hypothetical protein